MPINDPKALAPPMREATIAWLDAGNGKFWIVSGVRTYDEQVALYQAYLNGTGNLAAVPGTSRHERGLAVDIGGDKALAERLAPQFGLGQTVRGEDWHYEVVNEAIASTYPRKGLTVAEFEIIKNQLDRMEGKLNLLLKSRVKRLTERILRSIRRTTDPKI